MKLLLSILSLCSLAPIASAKTLVTQTQDLTVVYEISAGVGGFTEVLDAQDRFGSALESIGDLDGDGVIDLVVGAEWDDRRGFLASGALYVLFMNVDGTVKGSTSIRDSTSGFSGITDSSDLFGSAVAFLGDLNGDGLIEIAASASGHGPVGGETGSVWVLTLDQTGQVVTDMEINGSSGGFGGALDQFDFFGSSLEAIGDLDGDGTVDLAVGAAGDDDGGFSASGAVWILFLNSDGSVKSESKISATAGGFSGALGSSDSFGTSVALAGDLDGDGRDELIVGAETDSDAGFFAGAVYVLFINPDGTVASHTKITSGQSGFVGPLAPFDKFGSSLASIPSLDGDGIRELLVGARNNALGGGSGAIWLLHLSPTGTVVQEAVFDSTHPLLGGSLGAGDELGSSLAVIENSPFPWLVSGAAVGGSLIATTGAVWLLRLCDGDPDASFSTTSPLLGGVPFPVDFLNTTTGAGPLSWQWDFGDGATSTEEHPTHVYSDLGTFSVSFSATGPGGSCAEVQRDLVVAVQAALATERNGSGVNPDVFDTLNTPILGTTWSSQVDGGSVGVTGLTILVAYEDPLAGFLTPFGELLMNVGSQRLSVDFGIIVGGIALHSQSIPADLSTVGLTASVQILLNGPGFLTNAIDLVLGL